jgi:hypothetical protein
MKGRTYGPGQMKSHFDSAEFSPLPESPTVKAAILYDDPATGRTAKLFAERLGEELGCAGGLSLSLWRSELLAFPALADEAARDAADFDYLIVSLNGQHVPRRATREWIKRQLKDAAARGAAMIILSVADFGRRRVVGGTRHFFRSLCAGEDVPFFSLITTPRSGRTPENFHDAEVAADLTPSPHRQLLLHT